jgi:predicted DNA-binding transcriptional regulator AlpA
VTERRRLIGVSEIAVLLGLSKQRASILASRKGFPDPIEHVIPVDHDTRQALMELYKQRPGTQSFSAEGTWQLFSERAFVLPDAPRLWRQSAVEEWAKQNGRDLAQGT